VQLALHRQGAGQRPGAGGRIVDLSRIESQIVAIHAAHDEHFAVRQQGFACVAPVR